MKYIALLSLTAIALMGSAMAAKPSAPKTTTTIKPLTYANLVSFFKDARLRPMEVQKRCTILFEGEWKGTNNYNYCLILVENSDEDVQVTFYLTDAHEMNWVTEFLDAPFLHQRKPKGSLPLSIQAALPEEKPLDGFASIFTDGNRGTPRFLSSVLHDTSLYLL